MKKKAQFYIFTAIILSALAFSLVTTTSKIKEPTTAFSELHQNFLKESPVVINNALYEKKNITHQFKLFADEFILYARTKDPLFRFVYILAYNNKTAVNNYLDTQINVTTTKTSFILSPNSSAIINRTNLITIYLNNVKYNFTINDKDNIQLKAIFRSAKGNEIKVYVYE